MKHIVVLIRILLTLILLCFSYKETGIFTFVVLFLIALRFEIDSLTKINKE